MKNLFNNMGSSEIGRILEMHKRQGYSLSEQVRAVDTEAGKKALKNAADALMNDKDVNKEGNKLVGIPGREDDTRPDYLKFDIPNIINIDGSLFKNGIANIDKNNSNYKKAITALKKIPSNMSVNITGGASDVGTRQGYDNPKLAMLRATNFIKAAQSDGVEVKMVPSGKVGKNTVRDSSGAEAEQFVKIDFTKDGGFKHVMGRDNTSVDLKQGGRYSGDGNKQTGKRYKVCLRGLSKQQLDYILITYPGKIVSKGEETPIG